MKDPNDWFNSDVGNMIERIAASQGRLKGGMIRNQAAKIKEAIRDVLFPVYTDAALWREYYTRVCAEEEKKKTPY